MVTPSFLLLLGAAAAVAVLHSILPDHWVPLALVARTQRWKLTQVIRISALASAGHVIASLGLGGIVAIIGLQFQKQIETQQGHIIGVILALTGVIFLVWGWIGHGPHSHSGGHTHDLSHRHTHDHTHDLSHHTHEYEHKHTASHSAKHVTEEKLWEKTLLKRFAAIAIPFGVAASPDLTILPIALAASAVGTSTVVGVLGVFSLLTIATFIGLTVVATLAGYQIKGAWLEEHANTITSLVLIAIGIVAFIGL